MGLVGTSGGEEHMVTPASEIQAIREEGARAMLDSLIALRVIYLDLPNQAVRPGSPVGIEQLDKELSVRGIRRD